MTKLQELINELCPNGVEYRKIKDIAQVGTGSNNGQDADDNGKYPFFVRSQSIKRKNTFEFDEEAIIIPGEGGIGDIFHYVNEKYALHQRVYRIHFVVDFVNVKFAYYYMIANFKSFILKKAVSSTVTSIRKPMIEQFSIPLPPLSVQCEIVRILDRFAEYAAELQAELQARKEQYEYYRNKLLTFNEIQGGVVWKKMSEVCIKICSGGTPSRRNVEYYSGNIPWLRTQEVDWCEVYDTEMKITEEAIRNSSAQLIPANCVIIAMYGATAGKVCINKIPITTNQACCNLEMDNSVAYYKYIYYWLCNNYLTIKNMGEGSQNNLNAQKIKNLLIPLPPLSEQRRIADILDRFEVLTNDLVAGLPAEIAAVKEQYEYYRNKLLTFERLSA